MLSLSSGSSLSLSFSRFCYIVLYLILYQSTLILTNEITDEVQNISPNSKLYRVNYFLRENLKLHLSELAPLYIYIICGSSGGVAVIIIIIVIACCCCKKAEEEKKQELEMQKLKEEQEKRKKYKEQQREQREKEQLKIESPRKNLNGSGNYYT